ncbi:ABC transporter related protein [Segniliparus rotundus DSM 44985]|uniref:ABC transporter related protein n=1 Tax=Segniliparus rotundus (strain ATCC BAA-972 / CDC 1076 / CIP 108378 / DSM 44985 / JCM 13578) TaxID=640132 RepID=D6Z804_SEGRD|nr:amino acid ABC transporter ATP-binding protein [Segniliparus rotundus]ADG98084.1 ABC transporter related protein [Segniliparus rotundus DSM 44985]
MTPVLRASGVRKQYAKAGRPVLDGLDLDLAEGECVALIGGSGSGKSTLLRCLALLERVDDGTILFEGQDVCDPRADAAAVRARMGVVFQAYNLFPHCSVLDNLTLAPIRVQKKSKSNAREQALAMLARVGLADKARAKPGELSGGQQQRVAIARALVTNPRLLLLDEVTAALDPELTGEVLDLLRQIRADGTTMLLATHELGFAREAADQVCFLAEGKVLERGSPSELFDNPKSDRLRSFLNRSRRP